MSGSTSHPGRPRRLGKHDQRALTGARRRLHHRGPAVHAFIRLRADAPARSRGAEVRRHRDLASPSSAGWTRLVPWPTTDCVPPPSTDDAGGDAYVDPYLHDPCNSCSPARSGTRTHLALRFSRRPRLRGHRSDHRIGRAPNDSDKEHDRSVFAGRRPYLERGRTGPNMPQQRRAAHRRRPHDHVRKVDG